MSSYEESKKELKDEFFPDEWRYFTNQYKYLGVEQRTDKSIQNLKVNVLLKNISSSLEYKKYIKQIACHLSMNKCKNCMQCLRVKPCLWCYSCKHWDPQYCSRLICFSNPDKNDPFFNSPLGEWPQ